MVVLGSRDEALRHRAEAIEPEKPEDTQESEDTEGAERAQRGQHGKPVEPVLLEVPTGTGSYIPPQGELDREEHRDDIADVDHCLEGSIPKGARVLQEEKNNGAEDQDHHHEVGDRMTEQSVETRTEASRE